MRWADARVNKKGRIRKVVTSVICVAHHFSVHAHTAEYNETE